jgi:soluble lytic murein transglycosylase
MLVPVLLIIAAVLALFPLLPRAEEVVLRVLYPLEYERQIKSASREYGADPALVAAVIHVESRFGHESESSEGAYGLMQILPSTANFISERSGIEGDYREPGVNIRMGTWYLGYLEGRYLGDERLMLAAYNSGEGTVDAWISEEGFDVRRDIPYAETRNYVENVLEARETYRRLYGRDLSGGP